MLSRNTATKMQPPDYFETGICVLVIISHPSDALKNSVQHQSWFSSNQENVPGKENQEPRAQKAQGAPTMHNHGVWCCTRWRTTGTLQGTPPKIPGVLCQSVSDLHKDWGGLLRDCETVPHTSLSSTPCNSGLQKNRSPVKDGGKACNMQKLKKKNSFAF